MLAGQPPFTGPGVMTVLSQHAVQLVPPLRVKRPEIPDGIERAIEKALAKAPDDRYPTAAQFVEALTAGAMGTPIPVFLCQPRYRHSPQPATPAHQLCRARERADRVRETLTGDAAPDLDRHRRLRKNPPGVEARRSRARELSRRGVVRGPGAPLRREWRRRGRRAGVGRARGTGNGLTETLCRHVRGKRALLVLDNCEHLLESSRELVDALLGAGDELRILITSREGLGIDGERPFAVRSLPVPRRNRRATSRRSRPRRPCSCSWTGRGSWIPVSR